MLKERNKRLLIKENNLIKKYYDNPYGKYYFENVLYTKLSNKNEGRKTSKKNI